MANYVTLGLWKINEGAPDVALTAICLRNEVTNKICAKVAELKSNMSYATAREMFAWLGEVTLTEMITQYTMASFLCPEIESAAIEIA